MEVRVIVVPLLVFSPGVFIRATPTQYSSNYPWSSHSGVAAGGGFQGVKQI
jgi:hypothetical protein